MAILREPTADHEREFDEEVKALTVTHRLEPSELRVMVDAAVEAICVSGDQFLRPAGLIFRQLRLASALIFEHGARRRYSLTRRLEQVKLELEGLK